MVAGQRHINQAMRELVSSIVTLYAESEKLENPWKRIMIGKTSQGSHIKISIPQKECVSHQAIYNPPKR